MWKKELMEILFSYDPVKLNPKKAINLKYDNTPSSLYKYKSFNDNSLELLKTDKMWLSRPAKFNDPFDCALKLAVKDLPNDYIQYLLGSILNDLKQNFNFSNKELYKLKRKKESIHNVVKLYVKKTEPNLNLKERNKLIEEMENSIKNDHLNLGLKKNIHVACFSETRESILMWSHYANNHKGFCIEYNFKELGLNNPFARFIFPVNYTDTIFDMKYYLPNSNKEFEDVLKKYLDGIREDDILNGIKHPERNKNANNMVVFYNALNKYKDWDYEKEWRYVFPYKNSKNKPVYLPVPKPKAIYLGAMISDENGKKILEIGKERNIDIYKMNIKPSEFALESNKIN